MSLIDIAIADAQELPVISTPEALLTIVSAKVIPLKNDESHHDKQIELVLKGPEDAKKVRYYLGIVRASDDSEQKQDRLVRIKKFMESFQIFPLEINPVGDPDLGDQFGPLPTWIGKSGWCTGSVKDDPQFGKRWEISGFIPRK